MLFTNPTTADCDRYLHYRSRSQNRNLTPGYGGVECSDTETCCLQTQLLLTNRNLTPGYGGVECSDTETCCLQTQLLLTVIDTCIIDLVHRTIILLQATEETSAVTQRHAVYKPNYC
ncbi:hypothetical protein J6590_070816 [Homalodisca vitripennis]|nr:hypothetical protein J6590_070815 [Homalodisca vitripennis]KAG8280886.1 hypothetical protein J6590_070816 [Homalodisca vitripennis]